MCRIIPPTILRARLHLVYNETSPFLLYSNTIKFTAKIFHRNFTGHFVLSVSTPLERETGVVDKQMSPQNKSHALVDDTTLKHLKRNAAAFELKYCSVYKLKVPSVRNTQSMLISWYIFRFLRYSRLFQG